MLRLKFRVLCFGLAEKGVESLFPDFSKLIDPIFHRQHAWRILTLLSGLLVLLVLVLAILAELILGILGSTTSHSRLVWQLLPSFMLILFILHC